MTVKKAVGKFSDKLAKVDDNFTVHMYDNGFMVDVRGRTAGDEWGSAKIIAADADELVKLIREVISAERSE